MAGLRRRISVDFRTCRCGPTDLAAQAGGIADVYGIRDRGVVRVGTTGLRAGDLRARTSIAMTELEQLLEELVHKWRTDDIDIRRGVDHDEIRSFEQRFNVELPLDVIAYLKKVDGMPENAMDAELFRLWPLREFDRPSALRMSDGAVFDRYFIFADHSISAYHFAVTMGRTSAGEVAMVADRPLRVASSFRQFIDRYLHDPDALFHPERD